jgi:uncharacterized repeat protein (TIGR03833 family)
MREQDGRVRSDIKLGMNVSIGLKQHQRTGQLAEGAIKDILTNSEYHLHGILV